MAGNNTDNTRPQPIQILGRLIHNRARTPEMKIKQESTSNIDIERRCGLRSGPFDVRRSAFGVDVPIFSVVGAHPCFGFHRAGRHRALFREFHDFELRASDNRATGIAAEQAIEGAARYVGYALGILPRMARCQQHQFSCEAVPLGDAHFGSSAATRPARLPRTVFRSRGRSLQIELNRAGTNALSYLPNMTLICRRYCGLA